MSCIKLLSKDDIAYLNKKYKIEIKDDYLTIRTTAMNRLTFHTLDEKVRIRTADRSMLLTPQAIKFWQNDFKDYSLIEVQNAINTLTVLYQDINVESIDNLLKRKHSKIITIGG